MIFSSNIFVFLFLPTALAGYYLLNTPYRNFFLLAMSLGFYAWGEPRFVFAMAGSILFNYAMAMLVDWLRPRKALCKAAMIVCVGGNLSLLFVYKYLDFFIRNVNRVGLDLPLAGFVLPIGISFFTFQAMSYVLDVYRRDVRVQRKPWLVGLYISFFPQLVAGPIVRYSTIADQMENRAVDLEAFGEGVRRFIMGFAKKILLANNMALIADHAFSIPDAERSVAYAWLGAVAYSFQILYDFSGYSDMAIGLGKMFGFQFLENFRHPYSAKSASEFWRRWHISLGQWFRDYVYFPLGGSRVKTAWRLLFNLFIVWMLTGAWHGANWTFVLWGFMWFALIAFEKLTGCPGNFKAALAGEAYRVFTLLCVLGGWVLFRATDLGAAAGYGMSMLALRGNSIFCDNVVVSVREYWVFLLASFICSSGFAERLGAISAGPIAKAAAGAVSVCFYIFCFMWSVSFLILGAHNPFIYFNF